LPGRVAVVTGASTGIGKAIAIELARHGARVVLTARTLQPSEGTIGSLAETASEIESIGGSAAAIQADLTSEDDIRQLYARAVEAWGKVDVLVNNAAVMPYHVPLFEAKASQLDKEFHVNVRAPFLLTQLFSRHMASAGGGVIINISSCTAHLPPPPDFGLAANPRWASVTYGPSKAALDRLSVGMAYELFSLNVSVVGLYPGFTLTERLRVDPPPGVDLSQAGSAAGVARAVVTICRDPMAYTGRVLVYQDVQGLEN
jgi:NAD(P)-dependent dehydrogenase (short-subunit alcohol dehydrogenase family)